MLDRLYKLFVLSLLPLAGCAHFATRPEPGAWQHPQVEAQDADIVSLLRKIDANTGWKFVHWNAEQRRILLTFTTPMGFVDDIVVRLSGSKKIVQLMIDSRSRTGWYDFGQNRKHVQELIQLLRTQFVLVNPKNDEALSSNTDADTVRVMDQDEDLHIRRIPEN